ncbi:MAG: 3-hydroxyacyl-CoA dehydrogenase family protein, partial [Flavobacteriales bacterium]
MNDLNKTGVIGLGTMGRGIALLAAKAGETVMAYDSDEKAFKEAREHTIQRLDKAVEKGKISREEAARAQQRIIWAEDIHAFSGCGLVIEAISEDIAVKKKVFRGLEEVVGSRCIVATNTSSLPVTAIAGACKTPERVIGTHFFNPADVMPLVELVPALQTDKNVTDSTRRR